MAENSQISPESSQTLQVSNVLMIAVAILTCLYACLTVVTHFWQLLRNNRVALKITPYLYNDSLTDRFSISWQRWEPPFLGFCWNLVPCGLFGSYLGVKNISSLSLPIWAWGHTLYFSLQCKTNPMFGIANFFLNSGHIHILVGEK